MSVAYPQIPEHDKLKAIPEGHRFMLQEFLDWLEAQDICFGQYILHQDKRLQSEFIEITEGPEKIMARFFGIDLQRLAEEKDAILEYLRAANDE